MSTTPLLTMMMRRAWALARWDGRTIRGCRRSIRTTALGRHPEEEEEEGWTTGGVVRPRDKRRGVSTAMGRGTTTGIPGMTNAIITFRRGGSRSLGPSWTPLLGSRRRRDLISRDGRPSRRRRTILNGLAKRRRRRRRLRSFFKRPIPPTAAGATTTRTTTTTTMVPLLTLISMPMATIPTMAATTAVPTTTTATTTTILTIRTIQPYPTGTWKHRSTTSKATTPPSACTRTIDANSSPPFTRSCREATPRRAAPEVLAGRSGDP
mmetsp:Transcript_37904/g.91444  ORF Transcript_37904/g.91444 Transcript_37904/m.91444 type:complete len:265 (-) Transcript_37904:385-1179(-)